MRAEPSPAEQPPFFIVGNDRSGTTMLRLILDRGDEVAIPTESMFLGDFAPVRTGGSLADPVAAAAFVRTVWQHPKVRLWGLEGDAPVPPAGLAHDDAYRFAVEAPYRALAAREGKSRWGDKTPYYLLRMEEILAVWPHAKFVVLERDGRDVALSIVPLPFGANNVFAAARDWARGIRVGRAAAAVHPQNVLLVSYERLVAEPEAEVRRICDFLALTFRDEMLHVERTASDKLEADKAAWFSNLWAGINQSSVGKWRTRMSRRDQVVFAAVAGAELELCGYDLGDAAGNVRGVVPRARWYRAHNLGVQLRNFVKLRLLQERGRELRYVVRRKLQRL